MMRKKMWMLIALAIALLSVSAVTANSLQTSNQLDSNVIVSPPRPDGTIFVYEYVYEDVQEGVWIAKCTTIYPNGTTEVAWLKAWYENGAIWCDIIPPP
jgi:putative cell wall-binding protein